jgi:hypothetical protein
MKNVGNVIYGEQQLLINFSYVYVILMPPMTREIMQEKLNLSFHYMYQKQKAKTSKKC